MTKRNVLLIDDEVDFAETMVQRLEMRGYNVTLVNTVPSAIAELANIKGIPDSIRVINLAGEPLKNTLAQKLYQQETIEGVYNLYGPSEDTTYSTFCKIIKGSEKEVNIGRPIADTRVYVLDANHWGSGY